jgi:hypothetical protein
MAHEKTRSGIKTAMGFTGPPMIMDNNKTILVKGTVFNMGNQVTCLLVPMDQNGTKADPVSVPANGNDWSASFTVDTAFKAGSYMVIASSPAEGSCCTLITV